MKGLIGDAFDNNPSKGIIVSDLYPAISIKYLVDKIFSTYGYSYDSTLLNSDDFKKMIIPYCNNEEDLYGWHILQKATFSGATFTTSNNSEALPLTNYTTGLFPIDTWMKYFKSGIPTSYNPASNYIAWYIIPTIERYRDFNYGLTSKSWSTYSGDKHPTIASAGNNFL